MGAGGSPCAQYGWGRGGFAGNYNRQGICRIPPPLGVGGGLAGAMAAPSAIAPALGH